MLSLLRNALKHSVVTQKHSFPVGKIFRFALESSVISNPYSCLRAAALVEPLIGKKYRYFSSSDSHNNMENKTEKVTVDKEELRKRLTPLQYQVTQEAATERPFTGCYNKHYEKGIYQCIVCHQDLFSSDTKFDSGCGWPAFNDVLDKGKVTLHRDASIPGMVRTEVRCSKCSAHMGHVFDDGPPPKYLRYCINSASIDFVPQTQNQQMPAAAAKSNTANPAGSTSQTKQNASTSSKRIRTEVRCARCNAHMGHVFEDGPKPTRKRYCINSAAIEFISADQLNKGVVTTANVNTASPIAQQ